VRPRGKTKITCVQQPAKGCQTKYRLLIPNP
jgi:hypothetical protein